MLSIQPTNYNRQISFKSQGPDLASISAQITALTQEEKIEVKKAEAKKAEAKKALSNIQGRVVHWNVSPYAIKRAKILLKWAAIFLLIPSGFSVWRYNYAKNSDKKKVEQLENQISLNKQRSAEQVQLLTAPTSKQQFINSMNETYTDKSRLFKDNQVPIYIQELRKARMELYEQLSDEDKIVANEIEKYILHEAGYISENEQSVEADPAATQRVREKIAAATGDSTVLTDTTNNFVTSESAGLKAEDIKVLKNINSEIASKVAKSEALQELLGIDNLSDNSGKINPSIIKAESLAIIDALRALNKDGYSILTGANSDKLFNEACRGILKQYFNEPNSQMVTKKAIDLMTSTRDKIEKNMTPEEKKIYQEKYDQYVKKLNSSIYQEIDDTKNDKHLVSIAAIFIVYWLLVRINKWRRDSFD